MHIKNNEKGSIIIFTLLMVASILSITLTLVNIFIPRLRTYSESTSSTGALYAADSAMEWCLYTAREKPPLPQPVLSNGATYEIYQNGTPSDCPGGETLDYRTVGTYRGVSRSYEVEEVEL